MLKTLLVLFGILFAGALSAKTLTKMNFPMNGNAFVMIGGANAVTHYAQLPPFESWATFQNTPQKFYSFTNTIELDQLESTALPVDFDYTLEVKGSLKYKVFGSTALVTNTVTLIINSNPLQKTSRRLDYYTYSNAYESEFNIQTVTLTTTQTGLAQNVLIEKVSKIVELNFGIEQTTFSKPVFATIPLLHNNCVDNTTNELIVSWTPVSFAEEYELEIAFKDNYSNDISTPLPASAISYDFRENSTRIVTKQNYYRIPLVYERGYLLYRVRAVGMGGTDWNKRIPCAWSALPTGNVDAFTNKYGPILSHVGDKINWQLSTTYSDEGKRKDVVQYYDGLYMSRQTVTGVSQAKNIFTQNVLDNSLERKRGMNEIQTEQISPEGNEVNMQTRGLEVSSARNTMSATAGVALPVFSPFGCTFYGSEKTKEIIAQEVIYDFNGRPALQILPVPAGIHKITYIKKLNKNLAGASYSWKDFDLINNCLLTAHPLSDDATGNALGAGAYYSPKNPNKLGYNAFIPDSKGYPFSRVQYTFDNTGRTYRQADVGIVHELDIPNLVGHETKYYYAKPNQVELDRMFGNEVGYAIRYQKNMVVDPNGQVSVSYLNQEGKTIATALTGLKPDNLLVPDNESNPEVTINVDLMASNTPDSLEHSLTVNEQFVVADEAEYKFDYSVNGQKLSYNYCTNNNICLDCIYDLEIKLISNEGCSTIPIFSYSGTFGDLVNPNMPNQLNMDLSCADTSTLPNPNKLASPFTKTLPVGSYTLVKTLKVNKSAADAYVKLVFQDTCQSVLQNFLNDEISKIDTTGCYESCSTCQESNSDSLQKCVELCPEPMNECDRARYMMLLDVSPGGQYGQYDITTINGVTVYDASNYPLSVFNPGNSLPSHIDWRTIAGLHPTGTPVPSLDSIIVNWNKLTFPTLFLPYHPERCMLDWCDTKNTGKDYDLKLALSATDSASHAANLLSTTSTDPAYKQLLMNDPFFHSSPGVLTASGNEFLLFLTAPCGSTGLSVLEMAMDAAYCQSQSGTQNIINNAQTAVQVSNTVTNPPTPPCTIPPGYHTSHTFGSDPITKDLEWRMLRDFYRSYKEKYLYESRRDYSIDNGCFNGCIGVQNFWFTPVSLTGFNNTFPNFFGTVTHDGNSWSAEGHIPINSADPCGNTRALYESKVKRFTNRYDAFSHTSTDTPINLASINLYDPCATEANINAIQPQVGAIVSQYICDTSDTETSTEKPGTCWLNDFTTMLNQYLPSVTAGHIVYLSSGQIASSLKNFMYATSSFTPNQMALEYDSTNHVYIITIGGATGKCTFRFPARIHIYQLTPSYSISVLIPPTSVCCAYSTNALEVHFTMKYSDGTTLDVTATTQCPLKICAQPGIGLTHDSCTTRTSFALELFSFLAILKEPGTPLSGLYHNDGNSHQIDHMMDPNGPVLYSLNRKNCSLTFSPTSVRSSDTDNTRSNVQPKLIEQLRVRVDASGTEQARSSVQPNVIEQSRVSAEPGSTEELKKIVEAKGTVQSESTASLRSTTLITADIRKQNEENLQARQKVLDPCTIKFSDCDWMSSDATLISIQPYFENGIANEVTHEFIITYCKGSKPDTLTVRGNSGCFPINDCKPPYFCSDDTIPQIPVNNFNSCVQSKILTATFIAYSNYGKWLDSMKNDLLNKYYDKCMQAKEAMSYNYPDRQFHYTLYYYDQAGNLVRIVPPAGVNLLSTNTIAAIDTARVHHNIAPYLPVYPTHNLITNYAYNSLNQNRWQITPDAGRTDFWYDKLGRIVASQNAKQLLNSDYSYSWYDKLGRIVESGKIHLNSLLDSNAVSDYNNWKSYLYSIPDRTEITYTQYDESFSSGVSAKFGPGGQQNLRGRVASILSFKNKADQVDSNYQHATHYTYDVTGNVPIVLQDYPSTPLGTKAIAYNFNLLTGKVNEVRYEPGLHDEFRHKYTYDDELRLMKVQTSTKGINWETEAEYFYYKHGPLARTELGQLKVQGLDYIYTLQGWIKAVNGTTQDRTQDAGRDGIALNNPKQITTQINGQPVNTTVETDPNYNSTGSGYHSLHSSIAADAFGYVLGYFNDPVNPDYTPIDPTVSTTTGMDATTTGNVKPLYNGNISRMYSWLQGQDMGGLGMNYRYDQLNRLKIQQAFTITNTGGQSLLGSDAYGMNLTYDPNGNIMKLDRKGRVTNSAMDNLTYNYYPGTNKLAYVQDVVNSNYPETGTVVNGTVTDIDNQSTGNYIYDETGNLIKDNSESIDSIKWNLQNKITAIKKTDGTEIDFAYDALGNRVYKKNSSGSSAKETYYVRDAQGNILSTYELKNDSLHWQEQNLYGSSRIGVWHPGIVINTTTQAVPDTIDWQNIRWSPNSSVKDSTICGSKQYELSNHLGNVLATISDRRLQTTPAAQGSSGSMADLISATDYYAFGMQIPGRNFNNENYRFGFNGKENDNDVKGDGNQQDYGLRIYDPRLGKFLSVDPLTKKYPWYTPYQFAGNKPIWASDLDGTEENIRNYQFDKNKVLTVANFHTDIDEMAAEVLINGSHLPKDGIFGFLISYDNNGDHYESASYTYYANGKVNSVVFNKVQCNAAQQYAYEEKDHQKEFDEKIMKPYAENLVNLLGKLDPVIQGVAKGDKLWEIAIDMGEDHAKEVTVETIKDMYESASGEKVNEPATGLNGSTIDELYSGVSNQETTYSAEELKKSHPIPGIDDVIPSKNSSSNSNSSAKKK